MQRELKISKPGSLVEAFNLARLFESRNEDRQSDIKLAARWNNRDRGINNQFSSSVKQTTPSIEQASQNTVLGQTQRMDP